MEYPQRKAKGHMHKSETKLRPWKARLTERASTDTRSTLSQ